MHPRTVSSFNDAPAKPDKAIYTVIGSIVPFALAPLLFRELLLPHAVGALPIKVREDQIKYIREPFRWATFDTLFNVLSCELALPHLGKLILHLLLEVPTSRTCYPQGI